MVKTEKKPVDTIPGPDASGNSQFARALGSNDPVTREKGLVALQRLLQSRKDLGTSDMMKLWRGIFFCFWHSDLQPVQEQLATRLASIMLDLPVDMAYKYYTCMLDTMRREWFGIDRLRLDKFMMMVRKFTGAMFAFLMSHGWHSSLIDRFQDHLLTQVLLPQDQAKARGLTYHVADIFIPELKAVLQTTSTPGLPEGVLRSLLNAFCQVVAKADTDPTIRRTREGVFEHVLEDLSHLAEQPVRSNKHSAAGEELYDCGYVAGLDVEALAQHLFALGADPGVRARNREALYDLSSRLEGSGKKLSRKRSHSQAAPLGTEVDAVDQNGRKEESTPKSEAGRLKLARKKKKKSPLTGGPEQPSIATRGSSEGSEDVHDNALEDRPGDHRGEPDKNKQKKKKKRKHAQAPIEANGHMEGVFPQVPPNGQAQAVSMDGIPAVNSIPEPSTEGLTPDLLGATPDTTGAASGKRRKKRKKQQRQDGDGQAVVRGSQTPPDLPTSKHATDQKETPPPISPSKKNVRIDLRQNLYHEFGAPVPDVDIRTPPNAKPKGGALKVTASPFRLGGSPMATTKAAKSWAKKSPRATAASFF